MLHEVDIAGLLVAPISVYAFAAVLVVLALRYVLIGTGLLRRAWHPALLEVALYVSVLSLLILFV
ncbi:MAG TPA: DUF1656 domain-containing protein [Rhodopila sp.]|jgi:hypothetical protein|nr:DUF1656 domain-containing protein [Rhodopila sp.]